MWSTHSGNNHRMNMSNSWQPQYPATVSVFLQSQCQQRRRDVLRSCRATTWSQNLLHHLVRTQPSFLQSSVAWLKRCRIRNMGNTVNNVRRQLTRNSRTYRQWSTYPTRQCSKSRARHASNQVQLVHQRLHLTRLQVPVHPGRGNRQWRQRNPKRWVGVDNFYIGVNTA